MTSISRTSTFAQVLSHMIFLMDITQDMFEIAGPCYLSINIRTP
jgi:hypothetical protein